MPSGAPLPGPVGGCCRALDGYQTYLQMGSGGPARRWSPPKPRQCSPKRCQLCHRGSGRRSPLRAGDMRRAPALSRLGTHLQSPGETWGQMTIETTSNAVTEGTANVEAFRMSKSPPKGHLPHLQEIPQCHGWAGGTGSAPACTEGTGPSGPSHPHPDHKMPPRGTEFAQKRLNEVLSVHRTSLMFTAAGESLHGQRGNPNSQGM